MSLTKMEIAAPPIIAVSVKLVMINIVFFLFIAINIPVKAVNIEQLLNSSDVDNSSSFNARDTLTVSFNEAVRLAV
ncbi:hypothetical protein [Abyssogena phaseoliformis symbiont]|uniref:hypothetical protein n=1 Tax=Abyssogena phaseoliformis symbiont TaxID=596095 RepID=UPI001CEDB3DE|nr:hypothetical protein [Abyssogena phaseoliformis symbiont]MBW5288775.1 hypothetical protein [Candidatus Ruthia sp. Apha_13_S6]